MDMNDAFLGSLIFNKNGGGSGGELPPVTSDDNGKILKVVEGNWDKADESGGVTKFIINFTGYNCDKWGCSLSYDKTLTEIQNAMLDPNTEIYANLSVSGSAYNFTAEMLPAKSSSIRVSSTIDYLQLSFDYSSAGDGYVDYFVVHVGYANFDHELYASLTPYTLYPDVYMLYTENITYQVHADEEILSDASHRSFHVYKYGNVINVECNDLHISTNPEKATVAGDTLLYGLPVPINNQNVIFCNTNDGTNTILVVTTTGELQLTDTLKPDNDQWLIGSFTYIADNINT